MDHIELTTSLDVDTTCTVLGEVLVERGFHLEWENGWSATAGKGLRRIAVTVFAPQPGVTVVHLMPNAVGWYVFGGLLAGLWAERSVDRIADRIAEALTGRERLTRRPLR